MPPRWLSLVIVGFWFATTGWLIWNDLAPRFRTGDPPPYIIDLVEEVQITAKFRQEVRWIVSLNDRAMFQAFTHVKPTADGTAFDLVEELRPQSAHMDKAVTMGPIQLRRMKSTSRVSREGELIALEFEIEARMEKLAGYPDGPMDVVAFLTGDIRDDQLFAHLRVQHLQTDWMNMSMKPIQLPSNGAVLVPLHPLNRIQGLKPGRTWRVPMLDPIASMMPMSSGISFLNARVSPDTKTMTYQHEQVQCLVIEYEGEDTSAQTWVREDNGLVLRQALVRGGEHWVMKRD